MRVQLHSAARAEFLDAVARYEASVPGLGGRFLTEFARCVDLLCGTPTIGTPFGANLRRFVMDDFHAPSCTRIDVTPSLLSLSRTVQGDRITGSAGLFVHEHRQKVGANLR